MNDLHTAIRNSLIQIGFDPAQGFALLQALTQNGLAIVPVEATPDQISAMANSQAVDDEGEFLCLSDLIGFSGENATRLVLRQAYLAAIKVIA